MPSRHLAGLPIMDTDDPHPVYWSTAVAGPSTFGRLTPELVLIGLGLTILLPVVPFTLEFLALRRLTTAAFGTLMSLVPAPAWPARVGLGAGFASRFSNADRDQASDHSRPRSA